MAAKFEIRSSKPGEFNWVLTSQGRTLAIGESYTRKVSAEKAIASLRKAASTAAVVDLTLAPPKNPAGKVARVTGRALARAVVKGGSAVEKVEETAGKAATKTAKAAKKTARKTRGTANQGTAG